MSEVEKVKAKFLSAQERMKKFSEQMAKDGVYVCAICTVPGLDKISVIAPTDSVVIFGMLESARLIYQKKFQRTVDE